ncbi:MAG: OmpH family outer membrane protein [Candidatus Omnitrophica bacterium]|nr:OmpH family outer membrane protein [Candidatus Omnitrophota bacterium]MCM8793113.1 OmpH family outer membrane protein [Candidatus Omnitrophota bacterium]
MKKIFSFLISVLLLGLTANAFSGEFKIGYIDISKVFDEYQRTKEEDTLLEKKGTEKEAQRNKMVDEIKKIKEELDLASDKVKPEKQKILDEKIKTLQEYDRTTREDLRKERDNIVREILKEIDAVIQELGKNENYTFILNERVLLYHQEAFDLTERVIKILNERYDKKRSGTKEKK